MNIKNIVKDVFEIDTTKLENELGWKAEKVNCVAREATLWCENFDSGIIKTTEWYLNKYESNK